LKPTVLGRRWVTLVVRRGTSQGKKGNAMETSEVQNLKKANAILRTWIRQHNQAAVLMAIPLVAGFVMMNFFPSALSDVVLAVAPTIALTTGIILIPEDFRSRRGSMTFAICLVGVMWVAALIVSLIRLLG
jgi:hypothetical protein